LKNWQTTGRDSERHRGPAAYQMKKNGKRPARE